MMSILNIVQQLLNLNTKQMNYKADVTLHLSKHNPELGTPVRLTIEVSSPESKIVRKEIKEFVQISKYSQYQLIELNFVVIDALVKSEPVDEFDETFITNDDLEEF